MFFSSIARSLNSYRCKASCFAALTDLTISATDALLRKTSRLTKSHIIESLKRAGVK